MTAITDLREQIAARTDHAIREALEQIANGWADREVLLVMVDAWAVIQDLKDQVAAQQQGVAA